MPDSTSLIADTIIRTVELGLTITGAAIDECHTWITCRPVEQDASCPACGMKGRLRDHRIRELVDLPVVGHPTRLRIRLPRFTCTNTACATKIFQQQLVCAKRKAKLTDRCTRWILQRLAIDRMSVAAISKSLDIGWGLVNQVALEQAWELIYADPTHLAGVRVLGVDEHKWKHRRGDGTPGFVTVIVDLTPNVDGTGPARLLDMVPGRSAEVLRRWLAAREKSFRDRVKVVSMDGFAGYHTATTEQLPKARKVMDPFHVVHLAADKLTMTRQRIQQDTCGHRGRSGDPLYGVRRILLTRMGLLTDRQKAKLDAVFADERHTAVDVTHWTYQDIIAAYEHPDRRVGKRWMYKIMCRIRKDLPAGVQELGQLGRTMWKRRAEILAYFDTGASNGPVEAINGRLEHLRGIALGFRNLSHYILRSLIHSGGLQARINAL